MQQEVIQHGRNTFDERGVAEHVGRVRGEAHERADGVAAQDVVEARQHADVRQVGQVLRALLRRQAGPRARLPKETSWNLLRSNNYNIITIFATNKSTTITLKWMQQLRRYITIIIIIYMLSSECFTFG